MVSDALFRLAMRGVLGEVTPEMRLIVFQANDTHFKFRLYLDREPTDFVKERAEIMALNFDAGLSFRPSSIDIEYITTDNQPLGTLDQLDATLFRRWENSIGTTQPDE